MVLIPTAMILLACGFPGGKETKEKVEIDYSNIPLDPYGCFLDSESWVQVKKGAYIYRDDKYYSLNLQASLKDRPDYNVGQIFDNSYVFDKKNYVEYQALYDSVLGPSYVDSSTDLYRTYCYPLGDFEPMTYNKDTDEIRSYGASQMSLIKLDDVRYGYLIHGPEKSPQIETTEGFFGPKNNSKEFKCIFDDGTLVERNYGLNKGTEITASWYDGTDYKEYKVVADRVMYIENETKTYELEGELHTEGYATYDFSNVEPGIYRVMLIGQTFSFDILNGGGIIIIE